MVEEILVDFKDELVRAMKDGGSLDDGKKLPIGLAMKNNKSDSNVGRSRGSNEDKKQQVHPTIASNKKKAGERFKPQGDEPQQLGDEVDNLDVNLRKRKASDAEEF